MRKLFFSVLSLFVLASCSEKKSEKDFVLNGHIKGLKSGTLYIQRLNDTLLVPIDTIKIDGDSHFVSEFDLKSPEMLYLFLDRGVSNSLDNNIPFFAEKGSMTLETTLDFFTADAKINGSKNHALYDDYRKVMTRYVNQELDLVQKKFKVYKSGKLDSIAIIDKMQEDILKRKYLYTTNFAVNNSDYEVAPYVTLADIYDINLKFLDTIQKSMSPKVANSLYGKKLNEFVAERKKAGK